MKKLYFSLRRYFGGRRRGCVCNYDSSDIHNRDYASACPRDCGRACPCDFGSTCPCNFENVCPCDSASACSRDFGRVPARLSFVMRAAALSPGALAHRLGMSGPEEFCRMAQADVFMPPEMAWLIHDNYPQIDVGWLLTGVVGRFPDEN